MKLLNEFQEKAKENLFCSGRINDNSINCEWYAVRSVMGDLELNGRLKINGQEKRFRIVIEHDPTLTVERYYDQILATVYKAVVGEVANMITVEAFKTATKTSW